MNFHIPTKILIDQNILQKQHQDLANHGNTALIVTGKSSAIKSGVLDDLLPILDHHKIKYTIFNEIMENPDLNIVEKGNQIFKETNSDFIIAIGGGSPIDAAKAISLMAANDLNKSNLYDSSNHISAHPIVAISTTSGTGSEVTPYSVLNNSETNTKAGFGTPLIFPKIALLDPKYTLSLNQTITRDTAIDALSHLLEGIYSNKYNEFLIPFIQTGFKLIYDNLKPCLQNPHDINPRQALMTASNYGGIVIAHTSTTLQHSIGYPLTTEFGVTHGLANGLVMKHIMNLYEPAIKDRLTLLWNYMNITKSQFFEWLNTFDMVFEGNIDNNFIQRRINEVMNSRNMALNPIKVKEDEIINIFKQL
jgi:alcohol dehydrogenase class IV